MVHGIGLGDVSMMAEADKPPAKKQNKGTEMSTIYKYSGAWEFFTILQALHTLEEMNELLSTSLEFPDLGIIKTKADNAVSVSEASFFSLWYSPISEIYRGDRQ